MTVKKVKIKRMVPLDIFENAQLKDRTNFLFNDLDTSIRCRYREIKKFISKFVKNDYMSITYEYVVSKFKLYLYKQILNEAVETLFSQDQEYDIRKVIISVLTEDRMFAAINGETMAYTFADFIRNLPDEAFLEGNNRDDVRIAIERKYSYKSTLKKIK